MVEARPEGQAGRDWPSNDCFLFHGQERGRTNERRLPRRGSLSGDETIVIAGRKINLTKFDFDGAMVGTHDVGENPGR